MRYLFRRLRPAISMLAILALPSLLLSADELREWSDSTGRFKVTAKLIEVRDEAVLLENTDGKKLKMPIERLSSSDQDYLRADDNPFEMVEDEVKSLAANVRVKVSHKGPAPSH